ncbi:MAG: hypothetical protein Q9216_000119 [Gyalolechia sp. 2 TL-2023]
MRISAESYSGSYTDAKTQNSNPQTTWRRRSPRTVHSGPDATGPSKSALKAPESRSLDEVNRKTKSTTSKIRNGGDRKKEEKRNRSRFLDARRRRRNKKESLEERKTRRTGPLIECVADGM